ncbi:hypothetical protein ACFWUP_23615 [Nocardia sp. NPDC058658]|uniref:hypothetical protein n=1 Tax=Nocardia sp. NPDC058658 TaxID=3346580 RepID=UPI00364CDECE
MGDIDPMADNVNHLQNSLGTPSAVRSDSDLVRLEVGPDGTIRNVQLSAAARALTPDALVTEIVRVHTAAIEESQKAISAAIAALEADPRLAALTERKADAINQPLPEVRSAPPVPTHTSAPAARPTPPQPTPTPPPRPAVPPAPSPYARPATPRASAPAARFDSAPPPPPHAAEQPRTRSRQPTQEEEEEMDRYYNRKSWLEH